MNVYLILFALSLMFGLFNSSKHKTRTYVHRALAVLGSICRYHESTFEEIDFREENDSEVCKPAELSLSNLPAMCERIFIKYLKKKDAPTRCAALRGLSGIFMAHPRQLFALDQSGLISDLMSPDSDRSLQIESLRSWREILLVSFPCSLLITFDFPSHFNHSRHRRPKKHESRAVSPEPGWMQTKE